MIQVSMLLAFVMIEVNEVFNIIMSSDVFYVLKLIISEIISMHILITKVIKSH